ncbi:MAG: phosphoribosylformylglycinamidine synthase I [Candidatus Delongbacteria bacterium]|nr:phosphoribosylformylglycinamidine synthase I [Candidatus Delongbacteria bacterium]MBN2836703.1 phosphoribosylformylglycinamidine synthase I [Candidatus Delongbacteria bacterium]
MTPKVMILITDGINCNVEMGRAFYLAGAEPVEIHLNDLLAKPDMIHDYHILAFPGGFSYGDDIKSGKIFATKLLNITSELKRFLDDKKLIIGICNGFQVITTLGITPYNNYGTPDVSLYWNNSAKFECRWVDVKISEKVKSPWLESMNGKTIKIQAAHAEGRLLTSTEEDYKALFTKNLVAFQYVDSKGRATEEYPLNPNGSKDGVAGIVDVTGQVLGMMPHPERNIEKFHHPDFRNLPSDYTPEGLQIFINGVNYIKSLN